MNKTKDNKHTTGFLIIRIAFALVCSLLIWIYVTDAEGANIEKSFPGVLVVFEGEGTMRDSRGLIISESGTTSVKVTLNGNRRTIAALDSADLKVVIDLSDISVAGNYSLSPKVTFPEKMDSGAVTSAVINPETISFYIDKLSSVSVPVVGVFNGSAADGFSAEPLEFESDYVKIYGPEKVISSVDHVLVEVDRENVDKTLSFDSTFVMIDRDGNEFESEEISFENDLIGVTLPINAVKEVSLVVDFVSGAGATKDNVEWKLEPDTVTLTGDSETLAGVNNISVAKIDLSKLDSALTETYKVVIPNDTENTSGVKETTLTLSLNGLYRKTISIDKSNISCTNVSEGYTAEVMNAALESVTLRGPQEAIASVSDVNVRAVADLTDYGTATGILTVPVKIYIDGTSGVGAYGEYKVYINVTKEIE